MARKFTIQNLEAEIMANDKYLANSIASNNLEKESDTQQTNETRLLQQSKPCIDSQSDAIVRRYSLFNNNIEKYRQLILDRAYDPEVHRFSACVVDALKDPRSSVRYQDRIREYIAKLNILSAGVNSVAFRTALTKGDGSSSNDIFITKISSDAKESTHELFVGIYGTNPLKKEIPNFMYFYGTLPCSYPYIDPNTRQAVNFCDLRNPEYNYIVVENIAPSTLWQDFIKTATIEDFVDATAQLTLALAVAYERIGFTHYDLHWKNILIKQLNSRVLIKYVVNGVTYNIVTDKIVMLIDYGFANIIYNGKSYWYNAPGTYKYNNHGGPFPAYDIFKILCFSALGAVDKNMLALQLSDVPWSNTAIWPVVTKLLNFFTDENPILVVEQYMQYYYSPSRQALTATYIDFFKYLTQTIGVRSLVDFPDADIPAYSCGGDSEACLDFQQIAEGLGVVGKTPDPQDLFSYYDFLTMKDKDSRYNEVLNGFKQKWPGLMLSELSALDPEIASLQNYVNNIAVPTGTDSDTVTLFYTEVAKQLFKRDRIRLRLNIITNLANTYKADQANIAILKRHISSLNKIDTTLKILRNSLPYGESMPLYTGKY